jgi:ubiquinone/menaquinone biosynthesis C-methylase UbiE
MLGVAGGQSLIDINKVLDKIQITEKMRVADLGCGASGRFVFTCSQAVGKEGVVYAVDILKEVLDTIERRTKQENLENITTIWSNLEIFGATKIENNSLDLALLFNTLYQSKKRANIIREAARMLKKQGRLAVIEWKNITLPFGPPPEERVKPDLLKQGVKKLGLDLENEFEAGPFHYGLIFVKL